MAGAEMPRPFFSVPSGTKSSRAGRVLAGGTKSARRAEGDAGGALSSTAIFLIVIDSMKMQDKPNEPEAHPRVDDGMVFSRMLKSRTVLVSGEINKPLAERVIRSLILLEEESKDPIKVYIDSPGGDADAGYAIFDMMRFVKPQITMIGMGLVASAAAIIILAAPRERRVGLPNSHYLGVTFRITIVLFVTSSLILGMSSMLLKASAFSNISLLLPSSFLSCTTPDIRSLFLLWLETHY